MYSVDIAMSGKVSFLIRVLPFLIILQMNVSIIYLVYEYFLSFIIAERSCF